ncbi:MAG: 7-cyano-7-deazaguanine synthase QueC [Deltaproteobacteria bacterium RBG_16_71_12]|nr:MAG: 7-cyano-7-deazaguanine synthase QueC [Deltaproteobacteria bacterium RBG_16_71_12]
MASAVVLLSGGLDSATVLALARAQGFACHCLSFDYGQRHQIELAAAERVARAAGATSHRVAHVDLRAFGGSALTADLAVPKDRSDQAMGEDIPVTYVPARNTIFLSFALGLAEVTESRAIFFGANAVDYSGYPDCRPAFVEAFEQLANLATRMGVTAAGPAERVRIHAPLLHLSKGQIVREGTRLGVDFALTWSCYDPVPAPGRAGAHGPWAACGRCDSCALRRRGFAEAGVTDPTGYAG